MALHPEIQPDDHGFYQSLPHRNLKRPRPFDYAFACSVLASANSILLGYDIGVMSGAVLYIGEDLKISSTQVEILVGCLNVCSLVGSLGSGTAADAFGRRATIFVAANTFMIGALLMAFAPSFSLLITGRVVSGVGVGCALMIAPLYTSEISPATSRGSLSCLPEIFINFGILLGYISNYFLSALPVNINWRIMLGIASIPALIVSIGVIFMPESPRWLVMKGRTEEAKRVVVETAEPEEAESRIEEMVKAEASNTRGAWVELLLRPSPAVKRILITAIGINFFMQASGNDAIVYYSPQVFSNAGITNKRTLLGITIIMGVAKTAFSLVSALFLDRCGRRPLLLLGSAGMALSMGMLGFGTKYLEYSEEKPLWAIATCVVAVCTDLSFFSVSLGPITWVYSSEIFPTRVRAVGSGIAVSVNRLVSGVVAMGFLSAAKLLSYGTMFFLFGGVMAAGTVFIYFCLPETKGKTLEDISCLFEGNDTRNKQTRPLF